MRRSVFFSGLQVPRIAAHMVMKAGIISRNGPAQTVYFRAVSRVSNWSPADPSKRNRSSAGRRRSSAPGFPPACARSTVRERSRLSLLKTTGIRKKEARARIKAPIPAARFPVNADRRVSSQAAAEKTRIRISSTEEGSPARSRSQPLRLLAALMVKMTREVVSFLLLTRSMTCSSMTPSTPCARKVSSCISTS